TFHHCLRHYTRKNRESHYQETEPHRRLAARHTNPLPSAYEGEHERRHQNTGDKNRRRGGYLLLSPPSLPPSVSQFQPTRASKSHRFHPHTIKIYPSPPMPSRPKNPRIAVVLLTRPP
ncbi:unnamed protein product, partial [Ectocarpus fasciculatus]